MNMNDVASDAKLVPEPPMKREKRPYTRRIIKQPLQ